MNRLLIRVVAVVVAAFAMIACKNTSAPIYSIDNAPIVTKSAQSPTLEQVQNAIVASGTSLGWTMKVERPGLIIGTIMLRAHSASVRIPYNAKSYSILYEASVGLDEGGGQIHRAYNGWVTNLDRAIRNNLSLI